MHRGYTGVVIEMQVVTGMSHVQAADDECATDSSTISLMVLIKKVRELRCSCH